MSLRHRQTSSFLGLSVAVILGAACVTSVDAFVCPHPPGAASFPCHPPFTSSSPLTILSANRGNNSNNRSSSSNNNNNNNNSSNDGRRSGAKGPSTKPKPRSKPTKKQFTTLSDLSNYLSSNAQAVRDTQAANRSKPGKRGGGGGGGSSSSSSSSSSKGGRTRKSVRERGERPQQTYVYASQRKKMQADPNPSTDEGTGDGGANRAAAQREHPNTVLAKSLGMRLNPAAQSQGCYPEVRSDACDSGGWPKIVGEIRVDDEGSCAYVLSKPSGWCILGGRGGDPRCRIDVSGGAKTSSKSNAKASSRGIGTRKEQMKTAANTNGGDESDHWKLNEKDLAAVMTPEELAEMRQDGGMSMPDLGGGNSRGSEGGWFDEEDGDDSEFRDDMETPDLSSVLTPEELAEMEAEGGELPLWANDEEDADAAMSDLSSSASSSPASSIDRPDGLQLTGHPSLVDWLKSRMAAQGMPIRGGKYWKAVAGAVDIDDSGFVVLCPKDKVDSLYVDYATYVAVVGNAEKLAPRGKVARERLSTYDKDDVDLDIVSKLRTGRGDDGILTAAVTLSDGFSSSSDVVRECQAQFSDGIRGDAAGDPLDRRAPRRLVHCGAVSVSSLVQDDDVEAMEDPPDDIAVLSERGEWGQDTFVRGSYLGRTELRNDDLTTAYREINGAADGYPGWTVDRYDRWLLVQHDEEASVAAGLGARGPLPSIHDDNTKGIYYFPTNPDRSAISTVKPELLEGQAAPETLEVLENGIKYQVNLGESFSTGIFLDQRPQRAWLARHCDSDTRVLNCFAHCGAFSIAAAVAGASTVSLDLDKKWLDRIKPQMEANGIDDFGDRHDAIYGDCFDWLARLRKRGEKYDIVILDPPSTSVGGKKKKRWSVKNDMDELVALAAPLVKSGGLLWTTTNSASIKVDKFAKLCKKGLDSVNLGDTARLERVAPMPTDFSHIGAQNVKNLVWRL